MKQPLSNPIDILLTFVFLIPVVLITLMEMGYCWAVEQIDNIVKGRDTYV